jgi:hypothetical protein
MLKGQQRFSWLLCLSTKEVGKATIQGEHLRQRLLQKISELQGSFLDTRFMFFVCLFLDGIISIKSSIVSYHVPPKRCPWVGSSDCSIMDAFLFLIQDSSSFFLEYPSQIHACYKAFTSRVILSRLTSNPKRFSSFFILRYILIMRLMCRIALSLPPIFSLTIL